jgi:hypothetical protein
MTICPIAIAVGCKKCPIYSPCPLKSVIGDQPKEEAKPEARRAPASGKKKRK